MLLSRKAMSEESKVTEAQQYVDLRHLEFEVDMDDNNAMAA